MSDRANISFESAQTAAPTIELIAECEDDFSVASPMSVPRQVEHFVTLVRYGGFAGGAYPRAEASADIQSHRVIDKLAAWVMNMPGAAPSAATVLYNIVVSSHLLIAPLRRASVRSGLGRSAGLPVFPVEITQPPAFPVRIAISSDDVSICVRFRQAPAPAGAAQVNALLTAWTYVSAAGGMSEDVWSSTRTLLVAEEDPEWVDHEVWLRLADVEVGEAAFGPLVNALHGVSTRIAPIAGVEVE